MASMKAFWRSNARFSWKLLVYRQVIMAKLLYGLESLMLTQTLETTLKTAQTRHLRTILGVTTTFVDRHMTNARVWELTATRLRADGADWELPCIVQLLAGRRIRLLGHILREGPTSPLWRASFEDHHIPQRLNLGKRRVGRPKQNWTLETMKAAWNRVSEEDWTFSAEQAETLLHLAMLREPPFEPQ